MQSVLLAEMFKLNQRFTRSVNLVHDYNDSNRMDGYVVTPLSVAVLQRLVKGIEKEGSNRAWSVTGPYGTGKSACCLFLSQVLSNPEHPGSSAARNLLKESSPEFYNYVENKFNQSGMLPVLVSGSRRSISSAIIESLRGAVAHLPQTKEANRVRRSIEKLHRESKRGELPLDDRVIGEFESLLSYVKSYPSYKGVLLVVDELGKFLEYASFHPEHNDIFILQQLAELASRSKDTPFLVMSVLHQSFEQYADHLGLDQRAEWSKIQGRFEDIAFFESQDHFLSLVGKAIERTEALDGYSNVISDEVKHALALALTPRGANDQEAKVTLEHCAPLHPSTSLVIGPLFRSRLAQNERSLFAFLSSGEPYGFQEFLKDPVNSWTDNGLRPFYRIDQLYDYVIATQGGSLGSLINGKKWIEIEDALHRLPQNADKVDEKVIKTIGMLTLLGDKQHIKASRKMIEYAVADGFISREAVQTSMKELEGAGLLIYRKHQGAYALWEGSDIDLESHFKKAMATIGKIENLSEHLLEQGNLQPYVAKRHLYKTGTLRYFTPFVIDEKDLYSFNSDFAEGLDGVVLFVVPKNAFAVEQTLEAVLNFSSVLPEPLRQQTFFAIPDEVGIAQSALEEILAWQWVEKNTQALEGDRVARKELAAHLSEAYRRFDRLCSIFFDKETAFETSRWIHAGNEHVFKSSRHLMTYLSDIFDDVFDQAPAIKNELINRKSISSSAASARRALLWKMLEAPYKAAFGIEGFPPEKSIYISIFGSTGFHQKKGDKYFFHVPQRGSSGKANIRPIWSAMDAFLREASKSKRPIAELYRELQAPPYGVREGLLPVFITAKLVSMPNEVAVYEAGTYVPRINEALIERLIKAPERFELQLFPVDEARGEILDRLISLVSKEKRHSQNTLLTALRPLYSFINKLPEYSLHTGRVSEDARKLREILLKGKEPHKVLFEEIPQALDLDPENLDVDNYFARLKAALVELQGTYKEMLADCEGALNKTLNINETTESSKSAMRKQAAHAASFINDSQLKAFALRIAECDEDPQAWLERILDVVLGKIPSKWKDSDLDVYEINLADLARRYNRTIEILVQDNGGQQELGKGIRLGITTSETGDMGKVLFLNDELEDRASALADEIEGFLANKGLSAETAEAAVAELVLRITKGKD